MNNKWTQIAIALLLWGYLLFNTAKNQSAIGRFINQMGYKLMPDGLFSVPGHWVLFAIFSVIFFALGYIAIIKYPTTQDDQNDKP